MLCYVMLKNVSAMPTLEINICDSFVERSTEIAAREMVETDNGRTDGRKTYCLLLPIVAGGGINS